MSGCSSARYGRRGGRAPALGARLRRQKNAGLEGRRIRRALAAALAGFGVLPVRPQLAEDQPAGSEDTATGAETQFVVYLATRPI
jgi:hypothetical protein